VPSCVEGARSNITCLVPFSVGTPFFERLLIAYLSCMESRGFKG
jgi:hypothetical protein